jgi:UDP-glucose 4-epimerase
MTQTVLITGGAGYIGSHAVLAFLKAGWRVVVFDDLSTGFKHLVPTGVPLVVENLNNTKAVAKALQDYHCSAVVHFAGSIVVPESVTNPLFYYYNNSSISRGLFQVCVEQNIKAVLFSSTAAVYGDAKTIPITEQSPTVPINPYGTSKLVTEYMLRDAAAAHDFNYGILRYFNVAGADPERCTGQCSKAATHLIKVASEVASGKRPQISVFGTDYDTPDGTCIRDYIHVSDLAHAHVLTLEHILKTQQNVTFNCGYGHGYSVREVLNTVQKVAGKNITIVETDRRLGDPPALVADNTTIRTTLNWQPQHDNLEFIVKTALAWEAGLV